MRLAEAEAVATRMVSDAIKEGTPQALNYFLGQKYIEALQGIVTSPNQKLLMLPTDTTNVAGALAGIAEIAKEVIQGKWGNGTDRKNRITKAGYNYYEVQKKVKYVLEKTLDIKFKSINVYVKGIKSV